VEGALAAAERIAGAYAATWDDSSLARHVARYRGWTAEQRQRYAAADSLRAEGKSALYRDGVDVALAHWRRSLELFTGLQDSAGAAGALYNIGAGFYLADVLDSASVYLERARRLATASDTPRVTGNALVVLGAVVEERGNLRRAREMYAEALEIHSRIGDARGVAADHNNLGIIAEQLGDRTAAQERYETALALNRQHDHASAAGTNLVNLGNLASEVGDYAEAVRRYDEALATYTELDEPVNAADVLYNLGLLQIRRGDYRAAAGDLTEALSVYDRAGYASEAIAARRALASARAALGNLQGAQAELEAAEREAESHGAGTRSLADLALARADLALRFNQHAEAQTGYARALRLYRAAGSAEGQSQAQQGQATLYLLREEYSAALDALDLALRAQERG
jgi:tetratricopeptide (TPR) repeat protein